MTIPNNWLPEQLEPKRIIVQDGAGNYHAFPKLTTAERTGLTAVNGFVVYDSSLNKLYRYENGAWVDFDASVADASTTVKGISELATQVEVNTGTDPLRIVTCQTLENKTGLGELRHSEEGSEFTLFKGAFDSSQFFDSFTQFPGLGTYNYYRYSSYRKSFGVKIKSLSDLVFIPNGTASGGQQHTMNKVILGNSDAVAYFGAIRATTTASEFEMFSTSITTIVVEPVALLVLLNGRFNFTNVDRRFTIQNVAGDLSVLIADASSYSTLKTFMAIVGQ